MKRTKILGFIFIITFLTLSFSAVAGQTAKFKTWKITSSKSGGFAGISLSSTLDSEGNLSRVNKSREAVEKIEESKIKEIEKLVKELDLPRAKLKTVKGKRIYDGIYTGFVITLNGKDYKIEGTNFDDAKYLALTKKQTATLEKLKAKFREIGGVLPEEL
jgi:hypothetical protein